MLFSYLGTHTKLVKLQSKEMIDSSVKIVVTSWEGREGKGRSCVWKVAHWDVWPGNALS